MSALASLLDRVDAAHRRETDDEHKELLADCYMALTRYRNMLEQVKAVRAAVSAIS